jgi:cytidine deaminase
MATAPSVDWSALFDAATTARSRAHAPYSKFLVGAALLAEDGKIYAGCNVENASYGLSMCAERNACAGMIAAGTARKLVAVAVIADTEPPTPPCGACRQVLAEFGEPLMPVRIRNLAGREESYALKDLLPHAFTKSFL